MAKEIKAIIKLQIPGGGATPAPPVGTALGQHQVSIMDFCKEFNAKSADRKGETVPVVMTVYKDRSFTFILKTPPAADLIKKKLNVKKGSATPNVQKIGKISQADVEEIARIKMPDLNAIDIEAAKKIVAGTARSMGVDVTD